MKIRSILVGAAAAGLVLAAGSPALADGTVSIPGASVQFKSGGEQFIVCDTRADARAAIAVYRLGPDGETFLENHNGAGTCKTFNVSITEGRAVYYSACLRQGHNITPCSAERRDYA